MSQIIDLEHVIARALRATGSYIGEMEAGGTQRTVDAQWAAHRAARGVGLKARVSIRELRPASGPVKAIMEVTTDAVPFQPTRLLSA